MKVQPSKIKKNNIKNKNRNKEQIIRDIRALLRSIYNEHLDKITNEYLLNIKTLLSDIPE
jgi:hypothetical protein